MQQPWPQQSRKGFSGLLFGKNLSRFMFLKPISLKLKNTTSLVEKILFVGIFLPTLHSEPGYLNSAELKDLRLLL
jgi:hypothetical protein